MFNNIDKVGWYVFFFFFTFFVFKEMPEHNWIWVQKKVQPHDVLNADIFVSVPVDYFDL